MIYLGLITLFFLHLFTIVQTFIIGWGYSVTGFKSIQAIFGKDKDHTAWNIERGVVVLGVVLSAVIGGLIGDPYKASLVSLINTASWWFCFPLLQQLSHNWTLYIFKVNGYEINIADSPNSTAKMKSTRTSKIVKCTIGVLLPIAYYLI